MYKTQRIDVRLSPREEEMLDEVRGTLTRSTWIRNQIITAHQQRETPAEPSVEAQAPEPRTLKTVKHFHKPGVLIEEWHEKGVKKSLHRCAEPSCTETMVR